jgi:hypothetical protein
MQVKNRNYVFANKDCIIWEGKYAMLVKNGTDSFGKTCYMILMLNDKKNWVRHTDYGSGLSLLVEITQNYDQDAELVHQNGCDSKTTAQLVKNGKVSYWIAQTIIANSYFSESGEYIINGVRNFV